MAVEETRMTVDEARAYIARIEAVADVVAYLDGTLTNVSKAVGHFAHGTPLDNAFDIMRDRFYHVLWNVSGSIQNFHDIYPDDPLRCANTIKNRHDADSQRFVDEVIPSIEKFQEVFTQTYGSADVILSPVQQIAVAHMRALLPHLRPAGELILAARRGDDVSEQLQAFQEKLTTRMLAPPRVQNMPVSKFTGPNYD